MKIKRYYFPALSPLESIKGAAVTDTEVVNDDRTKNEEDDDDEAKMVELKTKYDDAERIASKLIQGNTHKRAIEKLTEALEQGDNYIFNQYHFIVSYRPILL